MAKVYIDHEGQVIVDVNNKALDNRKIRHQLHNIIESPRFKEHVSEYIHEALDMDLGDEGGVSFRIR